MPTDLVSRPLSLPVRPVNNCQNSEVPDQTNVASELSFRCCVHKKTCLLVRIILDSRSMVWELLDHLWHNSTKSRALLAA